MDTDNWDFVRGVFQNATWDLVKCVAKWVGEAGVVTGLIGFVQRIRNGGLDWWILGTVFLGSLFLIWWSSRPASLKRDKSSPALELPAEVSRENFVPPSQESSRDAANREKIVVLTRVYASPAYRTAQIVTQRLFGGLENSGDAKYQTIAVLVRHYVLRPFNAASEELSLAVVSPEETVEGLRQKLWKFFDEYQQLLCWTNQLAHHFFISLSGGGHGAWQEYHKQFYKKLEELVASDDFFQLPEHLQDQWRDI